MAQLGGDLYVKKAGVEYHASARYDDQLDIGMKCARIGNSSLVFHAAIFRGDALLVTGELVYVYANPTTQTSQPVPDSLRQTMSGFEAGEPGHAAPHRRLEQRCRPRRGAACARRCLCDEQRIPAEIEADALDAAARHAVVYNRLGLPVATGRLLQASPGVGRIGRMAVDRSVRGAQWGRQVLDALVAASRDRGDNAVHLHAQRSAEGFYRRAGFVVYGEPWEEAGIAHVEMVLPLVR